MNRDPCLVLSGRERDVLALLSEGCTNKEVAQRLGVAPETIKSHIKQIFQKLAVARRSHAVSRGHDLGLIGGQRRALCRPPDPSDEIADARQVR